MKIKNEKGFTLLELLVVMAIIGLLASLILVGLTKARESSRDAKRAGDIMSLVTSIEIYFNNNGEYPLIDRCSNSNPDIARVRAVSATNDIDGGALIFGPDWAGKFLGFDLAPISPHDPLEDDSIHWYNYSAWCLEKSYSINFTSETGQCPQNFKMFTLGVDKICVYSPMNMTSPNI